RLEGHPDQVIRARAEDSMQLIESTFKSVQDVMYDLRPPMLDELGLFASLRWYAKQFAERTAIRVEIRGEPGVRHSQDVETALFRIAQEALNNVTRHARAKVAVIELRDTATDTVLTVEDDGVGFDDGSARHRKTGYGL